MSNVKNYRIIERRSQFIVGRIISVAVVKVQSRVVVLVLRAVKRRIGAGDVSQRRSSRPIVLVHVYVGTVDILTDVKN